VKKQPTEVFSLDGAGSFYVFSSEEDYRAIRRLVATGSEIPEWLAKRMVHVKNVGVPVKPKRKAKKVRK